MVVEVVPEGRLGGGIVAVGPVEADRELVVAARSAVCLAAMTPWISASRAPVKALSEESGEIVRKLTSLVTWIATRRLIGPNSRTMWRTNFTQAPMFPS